MFKFQTRLSSLEKFPGFPLLSFCKKLKLAAGCAKLLLLLDHGLRTSRESCFIKSKNFGLGQTNWGHLGVFFGQTISNHFGSVSPFSNIYTKKTKPLYPHWYLNLGCKELRIQPSCVRSPCARSSQSKPLCLCLKT